MAGPADDGEGRGSNDSDAYTLEDVKSEDFARFLWVFYNPYVSFVPSVHPWMLILPPTENTPSTRLPSKPGSASSASLPGGASTASRSSPSANSRSSRSSQLKKSPSITSTVSASCTSSRRISPSSSVSSLSPSPRV